MKKLPLALSLSLLPLLSIAPAGCGGDDSNDSGSDAWPSGSGAGPGSTTGSGSGPGGGSGGSSSSGPVDPGVYGLCIQAEVMGSVEGQGPPDTGNWQDLPYQATVTVEGRESCTRGYTLATTGPLRDGVPGNPRTFTEREGQPVARTGNDLFDALYALAVEESREASVDSIRDGAFNGGQAISCPPGGCFETGRLWTYVWTRDTSYSVALGLAAIDPTRARNSMEFKTSGRRDGSRREIVQDTGTGGSWPVSSDRVVWALGARELLAWLDGDERAAFRDLAYEAMANTAERDRLVVWDPADGLYRGETSFLDWREQTYPAWTATDTVHIGMSKSLSTNVAHFALLSFASELAAEKGDSAASQKFAGWASSLRDAIRARLWQEDERLFSTFTTTHLDPSPTRRYDLLGEALAVLEGVATPEQAAGVVSSYPHLPKGAPVIWPQQQQTRIYHNRSIWPFVTAYWLKAAAKVGNAGSIDNSVRSMIRGAALNLSNMENFEVVSGANWVEEGSTSGPVVNSQRQLWSVAGYVGMVNGVLFGLETTQGGIRALPKLTRGLRSSLFAGADSIALSNIRYKGRRIAVVVKLPPAEAGQGLLDVASVRLNGRDVGTDFLAPSDLADDNLIEVSLGPGAPAAAGIRLVDEAALANYRNLFGPSTPVITGVSLAGDRVRVSWSISEAPGDVTFRVFRDGAVVADRLPGSTTSFTDPGSGGQASRTYCYSVEATFVASGATSQHAAPGCWWGNNASRIRTYSAQGFTAQGGNLVFNHGRWHYENWGAPGDTLTVANVTPAQSGRHLLQVVAGNGAGDFTTGITCGVKAIEVWDGGTLVGSGQLVMPQLARWDDWRDSSLVPVELVAGRSYRVVIREDSSSGNMSDLEHFSRYGSTGGASGRFNYVNITELKLLALGSP